MLTDENAILFADGRHVDSCTRVTKECQNMSGRLLWQSPLTIASAKTVWAVAAAILI